MTERPIAPGLPGGPELSNQSIFDHLVRHIASMPHQSTLSDGSGCAYRAPDGCKCPVGELLTDEETIDRDGQPIDALMASVKGLHERGDLPLRLTPYVDILLAFQNAHDDVANWFCSGGPDPFLMRPDLLEIAVIFKCDSSVIDEAFPIMSAAA